MHIDREKIDAMLAVAYKRGLDGIGIVVDPGDDADDITTQVRNLGCEWEEGHITTPSDMGRLTVHWRLTKDGLNRLTYDPIGRYSTLTDNVWGFLTIKRRDVVSFREDNFE